MACWVTLDELKPLLDNIGGDGVHLEMDFHHEREVEQALKIVDDFNHSSNLHPANMTDEADCEVAEIIKKVEAGITVGTNNTSELPKDRLLLLDGAMGTMI
jgi:hypothetical protein